MFRTIRLGLYLCLGVANLVIAAKYNVFDTYLAFVPALILGGLFVIAMVDALLKPTGKGPA